MTSSEPPSPQKRELGQFEEKSVVPTNLEVRDTALRLAEMRLSDVGWRVKTRPKVGWFFIWMLVIQNTALAILIGSVAIAGELPQLTTLMSVITASTLGETAVIVQIVVKWLFSDIDYK